MKRILYIICLLTGFVTESYTQQAAMFSQYMFNGLVLNPAYTGSKGITSMNLVFRKQWVGIVGTPQTLTFSGHTPTNDERINVGLTVIHDKIGVTSQTSIYGNYAYRINLENGRLAMGLDAGVSFQQVRWSEIITIDPNDEAFNIDSKTLLLPNFGFGIYYDNEQYYAGLSIPQLVNNKLNYSTSTVSTEKVAKQYRHYFLTAGAIFDIHEKIKLKPSFLLKYVSHAPLELDINASALFYNTLWFGMSYRTGDALLFILEYQINKQLRMGYSYDITLSKLRQFSNGSHEVMLGYDLNFDKSKMLSPRYF